MRIAISAAVMMARAGHCSTRSILSPRRAQGKLLRAQDGSYGALGADRFHADIRIVAASPAGDTKRAALRSRAELNDAAQRVFE
jgi:hypothetical protein